MTTSISLPIVTDKGDHIIRVKQRLHRSLLNFTRVLVETRVKTVSTELIHPKLSSTKSMGKKKLSRGINKIR